MTVRIRDYVEEDAPGITRLFYETVRGVNCVDYSPEQVRAWAPEIPDIVDWHDRMSGRCTLVAEESGEPIAFAELEENGRLDMLYCRKDAVGRGVGSRLYRAVEEEARDRSLRRIFTESSITALPFFKRRGFIVLSGQTIVVRGVGMVNFAMEKHL